jgi:predicted small secreted protein
MFDPCCKGNLTMKNLITLVLVSTALLLSACNTVKGVGQDIQKAGEKIEDAAKKK